MERIETSLVTKAAPGLFAGGVLQRKCDCGQHTVAGGSCSECNKKKNILQRKVWNSEAANEVPPIVHQVLGSPGQPLDAATRAFMEPGFSHDFSEGTSEVPPIVHDVLRSPGQPLDATTRAFMEPRFGHDFSQVRVHADTRAAESAGAVNALAYTVGRDVVFGAGQFAPQTSAGSKLMAHELTHVLQQKSASAQSAPHTVSSPGDTLERSADATANAIVGGASQLGHVQAAAGPTLFRAVGNVNCPPNLFGAPADPKTALESVDPLAVSLATQAADALATDATDTKAGIPTSPSVTFQSYRDHFGLPSAVGKGFMNRLTGAVRPSQEIAASEELAILSRRFRFSARIFSQRVGYRCPGTAAVTLPGCGEGSCGTSFAFSCRGGSSIALCQPFWARLTSDETKAAALIHESMHMVLGPTAAGGQGAIGETTQRGSGRNFNIAGCYEFIVNDMAGIDSFPVCPPVP
jgi:hypothetical protein